MPRNQKKLLESKDNLGPTLKLLPEELFIEILKYLADKDRAVFSETCQYIFEIYACNFSETAYGKISQLIVFYQKNLDKLTKNINAYKASQRISIFNRRHLDWEEGVNMARPFVLILALIPLSLHLYNSSTFETKDLLAMARRSLMVVGGIACLYLYMNRVNNDLMSKPIDLQARDALNQLIDQYLLSPLSVSLNNPVVTFAQVHQSLDALLSKILSYLNMLQEYKVSLIGTKKGLNLNEITTEAETLLGLKYLIDYYEVKADIQPTKKLTYTL